MTIYLENPVPEGAECVVRVSDMVLPQEKDKVNPMKKDYSFSFKVKNPDAEKMVTGYNFEDWDGFSLEGPIEKSYNGWNFVLYEGDKVSVETDNLTGSKALKIQKGSVNSMMKVWLDYEVAGEDLVKVKFDTYLANQSRRIHDWGSVLSSENKEFLKMVVYNTGYWHRQIGDTKRYLCGLGGTPTTVEQILDYPGRKYTVNIYRNGVRKEQKSETANNKVIPSKLYFSVSNKKDGYEGKAEGDGIYWIDNVFVYEVLTPKVENITTDNLKTTVIKFNRNIDAESVIKSNIKVYENGALADYCLSMKNSKEVVITFNNVMTPGVDYRFEISGIISENNVKMLTSYIKNIKCVEEFEVVSVENDGINTKIIVETNLGKFICIAMKKDEDGKLLSCEILDGKDEMIHPYNENTEYLFWDSLDGMRPLN